MAEFLAEDFRKIVDKLNEYMLLVGEADEKPAEDDVDADPLANDTAGTDRTDDKSSTDPDTESDADRTDDAANDDGKDSDTDNEGESTDDLLTEPSKMGKLISHISAQRLADAIGIPAKKQPLFRSAFSMLANDQEVLPMSTAMSIVDAFRRVITLPEDKIAKYSQAIKPNDEIGMTESAGDHEISTATIDDVAKCIKNIAKIGPVAQLHAVKLIDDLKSGIHDRHADGGIEHVMGGIVDILKLAQEGNDAQALKAVATLVNHIEGDDHAIDSDSFPKLVVDLILLVGAASQTKKEIIGELMRSS